MPTTPEQLPAAYYESRLLNMKQLEEMMGYCRQTITKWTEMKNDPLPCFKLGRGRRREYRFNINKVNWWIEKHGL